MKWYLKIILILLLSVVPMLFQRMKSVGYAAAPSGYVALTFDDGPHSIYTKQLLDGLEERGVSVSFFLLGENIQGNEALIKRMKDSGHLIGNHTYRHIQMTTATEKMVCDYVTMTNGMIEEITGQTPEYIRPPFGDWNDDLECLIGMNTVFWSIDSQDWKYKNTSEIIKQVEKNIKDGDIILMHDIFPTSVEAALELVDILEAQGYIFVTVDELLVE